MAFAPKTPIFVSSTYSDLIPFRNAVRDVLSRFSVDIHGMEIFGAQTRKPLDTCLAEVLTSEVFIGILGMRYGSIDEATGKSFVEREYETAKKSGLEIWIFLIDEENTRIPPIHVDCKDAEKLKEFKKRLKEEHTCVFYNSVDDLVLRVRSNLEKFFANKVRVPSQSKAFVSATVSSSTIAKGDEFYITGTATETAYSGVAIWVFGQNTFNHWIVDVRQDASYIMAIPAAFTKNLPIGQYFVVIQHPMDNHAYDVMPVLSFDSVVVKNSFNNETFVVSGKGSISSMESATNLIEFLNKSGIDDTYTKLQFLIEEPFIQIDPITPKKPDEKFMITGQTNLAVANELLVEVMPRIVPPNVEKYFGIRGIVKIIRGEAGLNTFSFALELVDTNPGEYIVNIISYKIGTVWHQPFIVT
jgi:hypothetical protein